jgi:antirestriction protein ArdC
MSNMQEKIADKLISILDENPDKWIKFWKSFDVVFGNPLTGTPYKGENSVSCYIDQVINGHNSNEFITFNAAKELAAKQIEGYEMKEIKTKRGKKKILVWEGEGEQPMIIDREDLKTKGVPIIFWKFDEKKTGEVDNNGNEKVIRKPVRVYYTVYNVELFKNIEIPHKFEQNPEFGDLSVNQDIKGFFTNMENGPLFSEHRRFSGPVYYKNLDKVGMPLENQFENEAEYLASLAHEYVHAMGHESRLNRKTLMNGILTGDGNDYPKDELVAEIGALMFAAKFGFMEEVIDNSKNYLGGWIRRISDFDTNGKKHFMWAIKEAHKSFLWVCDNQPVKEKIEA